jgi:hypothetical protein
MIAPDSDITYNRRCHIVPHLRKSNCRLKFHQSDQRSLRKTRRNLLRSSCGPHPRDVCVFAFSTLSRHLTKVRMKFQWLMPFTRYGGFWRQARRLLDRGLRSGALAVYRPLLQTKTRVFLIHLLENPDEWESHIELFVVFLLLSLSISS